MLPPPRPTAPGEPLEERARRAERAVLGSAPRLESRRVWSPAWRAHPGRRWSSAADARLGLAPRSSRSARPAWIRAMAALGLHSSGSGGNGPRDGSVACSVRNPAATAAAPTCLGSVAWPSPTQTGGAAAWLRCSA